MTYRVEIARNAEAELEELYLWVVARAPQQGANWFNGLERAVLSLDQHPKRGAYDVQPLLVPKYGHIFRTHFRAGNINETIETDTLSAPRSGNLVRRVRLPRNPRVHPYVRPQLTHMTEGDA